MSSDDWRHAKSVTHRTFFNPGIRRPYIETYNRVCNKHIDRFIREAASETSFHFQRILQTRACRFVLQQAGGRSFRFSGLSKHGQKNKFPWHVPLIKVFLTFSAATYNSRSRNNLYGSHFRIKNVRRPFADLPSRRCSPRSPGPLYVDSGYPGKPPDLIDDRTTFHRRQYAP